MYKCWLTSTTLKYVFPKVEMSHVSDILTDKFSLVHRAIRYQWVRPEAVYGRHTHSPTSITYVYTDVWTTSRHLDYSSVADWHPAVHRQLNHINRTYGVRTVQRLGGVRAGVTVDREAERTVTASEEQATSSVGFHRRLCPGTPCQQSSVNVTHVSLS